MVQTVQPNICRRARGGRAGGGVEGGGEGDLVAAAQAPDFRDAVGVYELGGIEGEPGSLFVLGARGVDRRVVPEDLGLAG
ncbi:MAG TPA: hypothetical protein VGG06_23405, partial [Thermoanaerobaculia bacterium]